MLGIVVTDHIYRRYPAMREGKLAKVRASVVSSASLAVAARSLSLGDALMLGKGEQQSGGRDKSSILADALEAVLGAVYLDGGWAPVTRIVLDLFETDINSASDQPGTEDFKTRLQEYVAQGFDTLPQYEVRDDGPDHEKHFYATVSVTGRQIGQGEGRSKKEAEQAAARVGWDRLASEALSDPQALALQDAQDAVKALP